MEHIGEQRRTKDETHLLLGLPGLQFFHHVEGDKIALLDVHAIGRDDLRHVLAQRGRGRTPGQCKRHNERRAKAGTAGCSGTRADCGLEGRFHEGICRS